MSGERGEEMRDGALPLLLLPGTLCDGRVFGPLVERLSGVRTEVFEFAGATTMREAAEQVLRAAPERFALLGFSLGGMVAMEMALRAPERVAGLVLLSTTPAPVPPERHATRRAAVAEAEAMSMGPYARARCWPDDSCQGEGTMGEDDARGLIEAMAVSTGCAAFSRQTEMALGRPDYRSLLRGIECPTLVVAGLEDRLCPPAAQEVFAAGLPDCTVRLIPGAGHMALLQRPDEVAPAVAAWFHTVERAQRTRAATRIPDGQENG